MPGVALMKTMDCSTVDPHAWQKLLEKQWQTE